MTFAPGVIIPNECLGATDIVFVHRVCALIHNSEKHRSDNQSFIFLNDFTTRSGLQRITDVCELVPRVTVLAVNLNDGTLDLGGVVVFCDVGSKKRAFIIDLKCGIVNIGTIDGRKHTPSVAGKRVLSSGENTGVTILVGRLRVFVDAAKKILVQGQWRQGCDQNRCDCKAYQQSLNTTPNHGRQCTDGMADKILTGALI